MMCMGGMYASTLTQIINPHDQHYGIVNVYNPNKRQKRSGRHLDKGSANKSAAHALSRASS
jgi:hypothetical protein